VSPFSNSRLSVGGSESKGRLLISLKIRVLQLLLLLSGSVTVSVWSEGRERGKQKTAPCIISAERFVDATSFFLLNAAVD
jgi:hypothetical protein